MKYGNDGLLRKLARMCQTIENKDKHQTKTQNTMMCRARKQVNETVVKETFKAPTNYVASDTMYFTCANGQNLIL